MIVALRRITRAIDLHSRSLMQEYGLTAPQLASLQTIVRQEPITVGTLAREVQLSQATMTGILMRLEKRELIARERSDRDRRAVVVTSTDTGRELVKNAPSLLQDRFRRELLKLAGWEQTQMLSTLQRIASMMHAEGIDASPVLATGDAAEMGAEMSPLVGEAHDASGAGEFKAKGTVVGRSSASSRKTTEATQTKAGG